MQCDARALNPRARARHLPRRTFVRGWGGTPPSHDSNAPSELRSPTSTSSAQHALTGRGGTAPRSSGPYPPRGGGVGTTKILASSHEALSHNIGIHERREHGSLLRHSRTWCRNALMGASWHSDPERAARRSAAPHDGPGLRSLRWAPRFRPAPSRNSLLSPERRLARCPQRYPGRCHASRLSRTPDPTRRYCPAQGS